MPEGTYRVGNHQPQNVYRGEQYIGVMFTAEDALWVVWALNAWHEWNRCAHGEDCPGSGPDCERAGAPLPADSCTCDVLAPKPDPTCIVHQGRRARGPKPPPLGPGCICDGSGRTCPRHGAVL